MPIDFAAMVMETFSAGSVGVLTAAATWLSFRTGVLLDLLGQNTGWFRAEKLARSLISGRTSPEFKLIVGIY
jgi:hypothetical protein